jgi:hypothetical protein
MPLDFLVLKLNRGDRQHKENLKYTRNVYEIIQIKKSKFIIRPLFSSSGGVIAVNGHDLKPYNYSELFSLLPEDIRNLMGESLHPDELKAKTTTDLRKVPTDFQDWGLLKIPPRMKLRNRLTPASLSSVPAISLSRTNTLTETMTETTLTFSSDDKFSDFNDSVEDVESGTTLSGVQIRTQQAIKNLQDRRNRRKRNIHSVFRRAPQFDGSLIRDDYDKTDELTEAPNLKTTEKGVKLVARTIIPLPPTRQPRFQLAPLDRGYSPPRHDANRRNKRRHLPPSDEEENDFDFISQIRTTSFRPGRLQQHQPQHSAAGPSPLSSLAYSGVPEISPLPSPAPSPRDHSPFQPVAAAPPVFTRSRRPHWPAY